MIAAVLHDFKQPLALEEVERPTPAEYEVLIRVDACGVCHSDLHVIENDWPQLTRIVKKPLIPGHEIAGQIVQIGSEVRELRVGDRVGVPWIYWSCGKCEFCLDAHENLCAKQKITGVSVDGGYAEFVKAPASHVVKIPQELSAIDAAPLFCAGVTVHRALKHAKIEPGKQLAIFGVGGLGHLAVQMGRNLGAEVIAVDVSDEKLEQARVHGASLTLNAVTGQVVKEMRRKGGAHAVLVTSGTKAAYDMAFGCVRPTGILLAVGLPPEPIGFPAISMAALELRIQASAVGTREDLREVLALAAQMKIHCDVHARPLGEVNAVLDEMRRGEIKGRVVLMP